MHDKQIVNRLKKIACTSVFPFLFETAAYIYIYIDIDIYIYSRYGMYIYNIYIYLCCKFNLYMYGKQN